jgi:hypothetical protein
MASYDPDRNVATLPVPFGVLGLASALGLVGFVIHAAGLPGWLYALIPIGIGLDVYLARRWSEHHVQPMWRASREAGNPRPLFRYRWTNAGRS